MQTIHLPSISKIVSIVDNMGLSHIMDDASNLFA